MDAQFLAQLPQVEAMCELLYTAQVRVCRGVTRHRCNNRLWALISRPVPLCYSAHIVRSLMLSGFTMRMIHSRAPKHSFNRSKQTSAVPHHHTCCTDVLLPLDNELLFAELSPYACIVWVSSIHSCRKESVKQRCWTAGPHTL